MEKRKAEEENTLVAVPKRSKQVGTTPNIIYLQLAGPHLLSRHGHPCSLDSHRWSTSSRPGDRGTQRRQRGHCCFGASSDIEPAGANHAPDGPPGLDVVRVLHLLLESAFMLMLEHVFCDGMHVISLPLISPGRRVCVQVQSQRLGHCLVLLRPEDLYVPHVPSHH